MSLIEIREIFLSPLQVIRKLGTLWLTLGVIVLGAMLGLALNSPLLDLTVSIISTFVHLVVILVSPLNGLLLWVVTNPFGELYINISLGESIPDLSPARFCVAFLLALLLAQTAIRKRELAPFTNTDMLCIFFMLGLGVSTMNEYSPWQESIQGAFDRYYTPLLVYFFAKNLVRKRQDVDKVLGAVLLFGVYAALYAIYENLTGNVLFTEGNVYFTEYKDSGLHVLRGLLGRSDHFGALFSMIIPVNFYLLLRAPTRAKKVFYAIALSILGIGIYITYKRTAWIAVLAIFFVIQWFYPQFRRMFLGLLLVALVVLGATWNTVGQSAVVTDRVNSQTSTTQGRTDGWEAALELWSRRPIFGYGLGNYAIVAENEGVDDTALENEHLRILFGAGLLGFVPYVAWLILILRDSIRVYKKGKQSGVRKPIVDPYLVVIFWGVLLGYVINYAATIANVYSVTMIFYLLVGTLVGSQARFLTPTRHKDPATFQPMPTTG
jgi:O-antigen ligase